MVLGALADSSIHAVSPVPVGDWGDGWCVSGMCGACVAGEWWCVGVVISRVDPVLCIMCIYACALRCVLSMFSGACSGVGVFGPVYHAAVDVGCTGARLVLAMH